MVLSDLLLPELSFTLWELFLVLLVDVDEEIREKAHDIFIKEIPDRSGDKVESRAAQLAFEHSLTYLRGPLGQTYPENYRQLLTALKATFSNASEVGK